MEKSFKAEFGDRLFSFTVTNIDKKIMSALANDASGLTAADATATFDVTFDGTVDGTNEL
eukprot:gene11491-19941_t